MITFKRGDVVEARTGRSWVEAEFVAQSGPYRTVIVDGKRRTLRYDHVRRAHCSGCGQLLDACACEALDFTSIVTCRTRP